MQMRRVKARRNLHRVKMPSEDETSSHNITKTKLERTRKRNSHVDLKHGFVTKLKIKENRNLRKTSCTVWYVYPILTLKGSIGKRNVKMLLPPHLEIKTSSSQLKNSWTGRRNSRTGETRLSNMNCETRLPVDPKTNFCFTKHQTESQRASARNRKRKGKTTLAKRKGKTILAEYPCGTSTLGRYRSNGLTPLHGETSLNHNNIGKRKE